MNLTYYLLVRIVLTACLCLVANTLYVLHQANRNTDASLHRSAESLSKQLRVQLMRIGAGADRAERFPDLALWKETRHRAGVCIRYDAADAAPPRTLCHGVDMAGGDRPGWFAWLYRRMFGSDREVVRAVDYNGRVYGRIAVSADDDSVIAEAWKKLMLLSGLSATTVVSLCLLVYISVVKALGPARTIVGGLDTLRNGDLSARLPSFELLEWRSIGAAVNALAAGQQQLLHERKQLMLRLMAVQEDERRLLARELHDEMGQNLAAINAVAASIAQSANVHCPMLVAEAESVARSDRRLMDDLHALLARIRPGELGTFGLETCLNTLIEEWNVLAGGRIRFRLVIAGERRSLPAPLPSHLYRIVQEALTNAVKHAQAATVTVSIAFAPDSVDLTVTDDGRAESSPTFDGPGYGLQGIRERVAALDGELRLETAASGGLTVRVAVPVPG